MHRNTLWIFGHRKCGTTLLTNLFDSHPKVINYGSDFRMIYAFHDHLQKMQGASRRRERFSTLFYDDRVASDDINETRFRDVTSKLDFENDDVVWEYLKGMRASVDATKYLMVKETSSEMYFGSIRKAVSAKFLHMVRDPRDNWAAIAAGVDSYYKQFGEGRREALASAVFRIQSGFEAMKLNTEASDADEYKVLRFEDLVGRTDETLPSLTNWLDIEMTIDLQAPTRAGSNYEGNSHDGLRFDGVSSGNVGRFKDRLPFEEIAIIEAFCGPMMTFFQYPFMTEPDERLSAIQQFYSFFNSRYFYYDKHQEL